MTSVLLGLLGAALGAVFFMVGFWFGRKSIVTSKVPLQMSLNEPSEAEQAEIEKMRDRLRQEQEAFHDLLGYNADVAYGRQKMPGAGKE